VSLAATWLRQTVGIEQVPDRFRVLGFFDYFVLWADLGVGLLVLLAGTWLVPGLGLWEAIAAILVGTLIGNVMLGLAGVVGSDNAIPSMVSLRPSFRPARQLPAQSDQCRPAGGLGAFEIFHHGPGFGRSDEVAVGAFRTTGCGRSCGGSLSPCWPLGPASLWCASGLEKAGIWIVLVTGAWMVIYVVTHADFAVLAGRPW